MNTFGHTENCYLNHQRCLNLGLIPVYTMGHPERYELPCFYVRDSKGYIDRVRVRYHADFFDRSEFALWERVKIHIDTCEIETGRSWHGGITYERAVVITTDIQDD